MTHPRDGADIDPDLRPIRHRVDIDTAVQRSDIQRGRAHHRMPSDIEVKPLKPGDGACGSIDGVNALVWHGTVSSDSASGCFQPQRSLVTAKRPIRGGLGYHQSASLALHAKAR